MRTRSISSIAVVALALAACGGDDDGGGGDSGGSPQDQVADMMLDAIEEEMTGEDMQGVSIDEDCVRDAAGELSDDDAEAIVDAGPDGNPDISISPEEFATSFFDCVDLDLSEIDTDG